MKRIISLLLASCLLFSAMLSLASCGAPEDDGAEIAVNLGGEVFDFDPTDYYADSNADQILSLLYEPLFKINSDGELSCAGASKYSVDEKNRVITVNHIGLTKSEFRQAIISTLGATFFLSRRTPTPRQLFFTILKMRLQPRRAILPIPLAP